MSQPIQPIVLVNNVKRFKANEIVKLLASTHPKFDANTLAMMNFTQEDREQFEQLCGVSLQYAADCSYFSKVTLDAAELMHEENIDKEAAIVRALRSENKRMLTALKTIRDKADDNIFDA